MPTKKEYRWHFRHETDALVLLENCNLLMHTLRVHQRLPRGHQTVQEVLGHLLC